MAISYHSARRGFLGFLTYITGSDGVSRGGVIPAFTPTTSAGVEISFGSGGGDASAANQVITNTKLDTLHADLGTTLHADLIAATPAGTNIIGKVGIDQTTPGTTNAVVPLGNVAALATDSGNGVKISVKASSSGLSAATTGQRQDVWGGLVGQVMVGLGINTSIVSISAGSSAVVTPYAAGSSSVGPVATLPYVWNSTTGLAPTPGDAGGTVTQPHAMTASRWNFAGATGGIVNTTTPVTIAAAAGAGLRNYCTALQIDFDALVTAAEFVVQDDTAGAILFRTKLPAGVAGTRTYNFSVPLKSTANKILQVSTLTATGAAVGVFPNAQGFIAA